MFIIKLKRVIKAGVLAFWRNGFVSLAAVLVLTVALFVLGGLLLFGALLNSSLDDLRDKVDINVYFKLDASEEDILSLKESLLALPETREVNYVSRAEAISRFRERHKDNNLIIASLEELDENPLGAILNIRAKEPSQYEGLARFLEEEAALGGGGTAIIDKVNFNQNRLAIERLAGLIEASERLGAVVTVVFALIAALVTINTIRLAIYTAKEEVAVMKLVGASNNYVRGPFVVGGALYGLVAAVISTAFLYPAAAIVARSSGSFFGAINLEDYFLDNLGQFLFINMLVGVFLGVVSSLFAVRRHLKV